MRLLTMNCKPAVRNCESKAAGAPAGAASDLGPALCQAARAQPQPVQPDEARRVALVVPALHALHRRHLHVVERIPRLAPAGDDVALVELEADRARHELLALV